MNNTSRHLGSAALVLALAGTGVWLRTSPSSTPVTAPDPIEYPAAAPPTAAPTETPRSVLELGGTVDPEMEAKFAEMVAAGAQLDPKQLESSITPWAEAEAEIYDALLGDGFGRERMADSWSEFDEEGKFRTDYGDKRLNPHGKPISDAVRAELDAAADAHGPVVRQRAIAAVDALQYALHEMWLGGHIDAVPAYVANPFDAAGRMHDEAQKRSPYSYVDSFTTNGWAVSVAVDSSMAPAFGLAMEALEHAKLDRQLELAQLIAGL